MEAIQGGGKSDYLAGIAERYLRTDEEMAVALEMLRRTALAITVELIAFSGAGDELVKRMGLDKPDALERLNRAIPKANNAAGRIPGYEMANEDLKFCGTEAKAFIHGAMYGWWLYHTWCSVVCETSDHLRNVQ